MQNEHTKSIYDSIREDVHHLKDPKIVWHEILFDNSTSFGRMVQVYSYKTTTTLEAKAVLAYPVFYRRSEPFTTFLSFLNQS